MTGTTTDTYQLIRRIPVDEGYDAVVAGGGLAGSAAAVCAARLGARTLLVEATGCLGGMGTSGLVASFEPEALKRALDDFVVQAGVEVRFFTRMIDAEVEGRTVRGVVLSNVEGYRFVPAKAFVDCTGEATLGALCDAECKVVLRDIDTVAPSTLCSLYPGVNWSHPDYGSDWRGIDAVRAETAGAAVTRPLIDVESLRA